LSGGDILSIYYNTSTDTPYWFVYDEGTDTWSGSETQLLTASWDYSTSYLSPYGASLYKKTGDIYLAANNDPGSSSGDIETYIFDDSSRTWTAKTNVYTNLDGTCAKIFVNEKNGDIFAFYEREREGQVYYKLSTDGMTTWGDETQVSTTQEDIRLIRPNFMSDERVYAFWYDNDDNELFGATVKDIQELYKMDIEFNTSSLPKGGVHYLELNYKVDGSETAFGVHVYDGSSWDDQTSQGDLDQTSFTAKSYDLDSEHRLGSGYIRVRFIGRNETSDTYNSTLNIEYHRIKVDFIYTTLSGEAAGDKFGWSVANCSDINEDGSYDDVIVGAPEYGTNKGRAYIFHGGSSFDSTADVTLTGENDGDKFGFSVHGAGDTGGDGKPDVIVGAPYYDDGATTDCGIIYVFNGGSGMDTTSDYIHKGDSANMHFGWSVSLAVDMDSDGNGEVIGGGPQDAGASENEVGRVEVLVIPEYPTIAYPVVIITLLFIVRRKKKKKGRKKNHPSRNNTNSESRKKGGVRNERFGK
jgi:hypothetical protein